MISKARIKIVLGVIVLLAGMFGPYNISFKHTNSQTTATSIQKQQDDTFHVDEEVFSINFEKNTVSATANPSNPGGTPNSGTPETNPDQSNPNSNATGTSTNTDLAATLEAFLKVIYVLLWPLLWIAGLAMDNSLVYGEIFGLDSALFKFWSIMKNFANFALGFLFVRSVISFVVNPNEKKNPKDMIAKLLVAGIGVQLSWFIVGALVDISTVLTVGVGGLPLNLMDNPDMKNQPIFGVVTSIKMNDKAKTQGNLVVVHTRPGSDIDSSDRRYILPCFIEDGKINYGDKWKTAFGVKDGNINITGFTNITRENIQTDACVAGQNIILKEFAEPVDGTDGETNLNFAAGGQKAIDAIKSSREKFYTQHCANGLCKTMSNFTKSAEGAQGAFYTLYASLLGLSTIHIGVPKSTASLTMETAIKTVIGLAYLIPLAILCVILIMRVGYLWLIIAFSPFIALASVDKIGIKGLEGGVPLTDKIKFNFKNVLGLLMLPVIVTFVISLSIVFLSSLSQGLSNEGSAGALGIHSYTEAAHKCYDIAITNICIDIPKQDIGSGIFDYFSWTIMNIFGISLMWFAVMAALKSNEFTKSVAGKVENMATSLIQNAPLIPIPGRDSKVSLNSLTSLPGHLQGKLAEAQRANQTMFGDVIESTIQDATGADRAGNQKMDAMKKTITSESSAANALITLADSEPFKNENGKNKMSFKQYDSSTAFAQSIVDASWKGKESAWGPKPELQNGGELFTDKGSQKMLAHLLDVASTPGNRIDTNSLQKLYSNNGGDADNWTKAGTGIAAQIEAHRKKTIPLTLFEHKDTAGAILHKYTIQDNKFYKLGKDATAIATTDNAIGSLDTSADQGISVWKDILNELNTLTQANRQTERGASPWTTLTKTPISIKDTATNTIKKYQITVDPTTKKLVRPTTPTP